MNHINICETFFDTQISHGSEVVIALAANIPDELIGDLIVRFNKKSLKRKAVLREYPSQTCDAIVESGEAEIGFNTAPFDGKKFESVPILACSLRLLVNRSHMYSALDAVPTSLLHEMNLVIRESKTPYQSEFFVRCKEMNVHPYIAHETSNTLMVYNMVHRDSQCFGIVPESAADLIHLPDVAAIPFEDSDFVRTVYMFKRCNEALSSTALEFEDFIKRNTGARATQQKQKTTAAAPLRIVD